MTEPPPIPPPQALIAHLFAPLDGPDVDRALRYLRRLWRDVRDKAGATDPIIDTGLPADFPRRLPDGQALIAARESAGRSVQVVLRREHDILNLSVRLAPQPATTWADLDSRLDGLLGRPPAGALIGGTRTYLAQVTGPVREQATAVRGLLPPVLAAGGWWHRPYATDGLALWDTAVSPTNALTRHVVLLVDAEHAEQAGDWIWAPGGHAVLPPLAHYFMHLAKIRHQHRVWATWHTSSDLRSERNPDTLVHDLAAMREAVRITWRNAAAGLDPSVADPSGEDLFATDATYTTWLLGQLDREIDRVETYLDREHRWHGRSPAETHPPDRGEVSRSAVPARVATSSRALRLLVLTTEWTPRRRSAAVLNRHLCRALVTAGAEVYCLVPDPSEHDRRDAEAAGVQLIAAQPFPGGTAQQALDRRQDLPGGACPDAIIGYGLESGPAARAQVDNHYPGVPWLHIVLDRPQDTELSDVAPADSLSAEEQATTLLAVASTATSVLAVGPITHGWLERDLPQSPARPRPVRFDPGFDGGGHQLRTPPIGPPQILLYSGPDETHAKGVDFAAEAIAAAAGITDAPSQPWELLIRGAPPAARGAYQDHIRQLIRPVGIDVRIGDARAGLARLDTDLRGTSLLLLPSRSGEFGVIAMEALASGIPVLVSDSSGLGALLHETHQKNTRWFTAPVNGDQCVQRWVNPIWATLHDRPSAFTRVQSVRQQLAAHRTWHDAATQILDAVPIR